MAFLPPEQQNQYAPQGQTSNTPGGMAGTPPPQAGGSSGSGTGAQKAGGTPAGGTPTQFGSSASKLGDYLSANAPQIQGQANTITGNLNNQFQQIGTDINNATNQFGQAVQGGYAAPNQDIVNQAVANPTQFVSDPNNVKAFQAQYNNAYTGPQNFESTTPYGNIQNEVNTAVQNAGLLNSQAGLQSYLGQNSGGNQTRASNTLDTLLLQGNPAAKQQIQQAAEQFKGLTNTLGTATAGANQGVTAAQQAAQNAQQYAKQQYGGAVTGFNTNLQNELNAASQGNTSYNQQIDALRSQLQSGNLSNVPGVSSSLSSFLANKVNPWFSQYGQGYTPSYNFVNALPSNINPQLPQLGQVASVQDYSTLAALNKLGNSPITSPLSMDTAAQAGTYKGPQLGDVNNQAIAQDILTELTGGGNSINVSAQPFNQFLGYEQALNNYLGNNKNAWGNAPYDPNQHYAPGPGQTYGSLVPTI